jgi:hypothetical protein
VTDAAGTTDEMAELRMTSVAALWRRLDVPGHDACRLDVELDGWRLHGTAVFRLDGVPVRLDYRVECDRSWRSRSASVEGWVGARSIEIVIVRADDGRWLLNGAAAQGLDDCIDVDFGFTPATNALQLRRIALAVGDAADVPVAWLDVPAGTLLRLEQRYHRVTDVRYEYAAPRFGYHAELEVSPAGFARRYPGLWELED